ncbi:MDR family MFS transporter [Nocardiopsis rhodophaea]|uniref:MDR family MFS transporter n=1 Tax=Nocardiopsis rhodophaea TaxID=280238 RepID=UPI0031D65AD2
MRPDEEAPRHASPPDPAEERIGRDLAWLSAIIALGGFMTLLDGSIVNIALGTLTRTFEAPLATTQWVTTAYLLALSTVIPFSGWAMERFGARRMWFTAQAMFLVGSLAAALAWSVESLIAFRVVQGLGGGLVIPVGQAILAAEAGPRRLPKVVGFISAPAMLAPVIGPFLGGALIDALNWQWIFYINAPIVLLTIALSWWRMAPDGPTARSRLDAVGALLLAPGLTALLFGLSMVAESGAGSAPVLISLALGLALLAGFVVHGLRPTTTPLIDLRLFRDRPFAVSTAVTLAVNASLFGSLLLLPLYFQFVRRADVLEAGLLMAPQGVGFVIAALMTGRLVAQLGARATTLVGLGVALIATVPLTMVTAETDHWWLVTLLIVRGIGLGAGSIPAMASAYHNLPKPDIPRATSAFNISQRSGSAIGTALLAVVLQGQIAARLPESADELTMSAPSAPLAASFGDAFWWVAGLLVVTAIPAVLMPSQRPPSTADSEVAVPEPKQE